MTDKLEYCWEIKKCGREKDGSKVDELGECPASKEGLGHCCWIIAGTFCEGVVQGTAAQKLISCMVCDVYKRYNRFSGSDGKEIAGMFPDEESKYNVINENLGNLHKNNKDEDKS